MWGGLACLLLLLPSAFALDRHYYMMAINVDWDYCPDEFNVVYNRALNSEESKFVFPTTTTLGSKVKKIQFVETDSNYVPIARSDAWKHLNLVGPIFRGEVGDVLYIHFYNYNVQTPLTLHPHGVSYNKDSEGAPYVDGTSGLDKSDDSVVAGRKYTYRWDVVERAGPAAKDPSSVFWPYHSHADELTNSNLGGIGGIIVTRKGSARNSATVDGLMPKDVDREFVVFPHVYDETKSDYLDLNIQGYGSEIWAPPPITNPYGRRLGRRDARQSGGEVLTGEFSESAQKAALNGRLFGSGLSTKGGGSYQFTMKTGERVRWYVLSLGTYQSEFVNPDSGLGSFDGFHAIRWHGQNIHGTIWSSGTGANAAVAGVLPATSYSVTMIPRNPGVWMMSCGVGVHHVSGMAALFKVEQQQDFTPPTPVNVRPYYIAIEEELWDYAPQDKDVILNETWVPGTAVGNQMIQSSRTVGRIYKKARYIQYTDATFTTKSTIPSQWTHLGLLGPVIRAEVGDRIQVTLKNSATENFSINPQGLFYNKNSEGTTYFDETTGSDLSDNYVAPGNTYTYTWDVPDWSGPSTADQSSIVWIYSSGVELQGDANAGLIGPILITRKGWAISSTNPAPTDVDREFVLMAMMVNENQSPYMDWNFNHFGLSAFEVSIFNEYPFSNWMYSLNGRMFGNLNGLSATVGQKVRLYLLSMGNVDGGPHAIHSHSFTFAVTNTRQDVVELAPTMARTVDISPQIPGNWLIHCHTEVHSDRGMQAYIAITGTQATFTPTNIRKYYIAAQEQVWNYAPSGNNNMIGRPIGSGYADDSFLIQSQKTLGSSVLKARYWQYPNANFNWNEAIRTYPTEWTHLGLLGPVIRGVVGEQIDVTLLNNCSFPVSIHPEGLLYDNGLDGFTLNGPDFIVDPQSSYTYHFYVPESAGPGPDDGNSISWVYFSRGVGETPSSGLDTGLVGPVIITKAGTQTSDSNLMPVDTDREMVLLFSVLREDVSLLFQKNLETKGLLASNLEAFSNERASINGWMFGNTQGLTITQNTRVRWHILSYGTFDGLHTAHWHGNVVVNGKERRDVIELFPSSHAVADMVPDKVGIWMLHCHYGDHLNRGMVTTYTVASPGGGGGGGSSSSSSLRLSSFLLLFVALAFGFTWTI